MVINIVTIFPEMITEYLKYGIISRALKEGLLGVNIYNLRDFAINKRGQIDDGIFGHGKGMLFRPEPLYKAISEIKNKFPSSKVVYLTPQGKRFNNFMAREFSKQESIILISARYEGIDSRIEEMIVDETVSIGDYVLTGGELPALITLDAVSRFVKGSIKESSAQDESFENGLLEYSHFTEPLEFNGLIVPEALRNGNHNEMAKIRLKSSLKKTYFNRIDLLFDYKPEFNTGNTKDGLKKLKRENSQMAEFVKTIQNISKEWKDGRRNTVK